MTPEAAAAMQQTLGAGAGPTHAQVAVLPADPGLAWLLVAISVGAVLFGANTCIGNGPNFMVKAIADPQKVRTPSFLGYVFQSTLPIIIPMRAVVWLFFFRR